MGTNKNPEMRCERKGCASVEVDLSERIGMWFCVEHQVEKCFAAGLKDIYDELYVLNTMLEAATNGGFVDRAGQLARDENELNKVLIAKVKQWASSGSATLAVVKN